MNAGSHKIEILRCAPPTLHVFGDLAPAMNTNVMHKLLRGIDRDDITAHGFRSTFRDWAAEQTNYPNDVIEGALAHATGRKVELA
jgi:integrase